MNSCGNPQTGAFFVWVTATEGIKRFASLSHPYMRRLVDQQLASMTLQASKFFG